MTYGLQLNLATQPFENRRRFVVLTAFSAGVLVLATIVLAAIFIRNFRSGRLLSQQMSTLRQEIARLDGEQRRLEETLQRPEVVDVLDRSFFLNSMIRQKAVSWTQLFMDLEKLMPERVQVLTLRPVVKEEKDAGRPGQLQIDLQLDAASDSIAGLLDMVRRMEQSDRFYQPVFQVENPAQQDGLYRLTMSVSYAQK
jgi:type IV pilus assembly protein PilN